MAGPEQDVQAPDGSRSADRVAEQSAGRVAAAAVPALCKPVVGLSAAQSFGGRVAAVGELAQPEPVVSAELLAVQMPEAHSLVQREQQEPARREAQEEVRQLMQA